MSSVQQSWSGSSEIDSVPSRRASAMISVLSQPSSGRRIGSRTASSSAVMFGSVWLDTWPSESPVTSARGVQPRGERLGRLEHQPPLRHHLQPVRRPRLASDCCVLPNGTTNSRDAPWNRSSPRTSAYAL